MVMIMIMMIQGQGPRPGPKKSAAGPVWGGAFFSDHGDDDDDGDVVERTPVLGPALFNLCFGQFWRLKQA